MPRLRTAKGRKKAAKPWRGRPIRAMLRWTAIPFGLLAARFNLAALRRASTACAWIAAGCVLIVAWILGVPRLQAVAARERYSSTVRVEFIDPPRWFHGDLAAHLTRTAEINLTGDPLDRNNLVDCRDMLMRTGWFESIHQVRRASADLVEIEAQFARPYTVVRDDEGDHLVDVVGRLLPLKYARGAHTGFIALAGAHFPRPQACGEIWEGTDIIAGLRLLQLIDDQPWRSQIAEVDISGCVRGDPIRFRTDRGTTIVWGGAPGEEPALEVLAEGKLKRLNQLHVTYGRIDAGETTGELDITSEKAVVAR